MKKSNDTEILERLWQEVGIPKTALTEESFKRIASLAMAEGRAEAGYLKARITEADSLLEWASSFASVLPVELIQAIDRWRRIQGRAKG